MVSSFWFIFYTTKGTKVIFLFAFFFVGFVVEYEFVFSVYPVKFE